MQEVALAKEKYRLLKESAKKSGTALQKLANLILSEEENPLEELMDLCSFPVEALSLLISIVQEEAFYNPLFPGYGMAPVHACECLGLLKNPKAIIPLFEAFSLMDFFGEETIVQALFTIGTPAKDFLLSQLTKQPFSKENLNAVIALLPFKEDLVVVSTCLDLLERPITLNYPLFFTHLLLVCEGVQKTELLQRLKKLQSLDLPTELQKELHWIIQSCKNN